MSFSARVDVPAYNAYGQHAGRETFRSSYVDNCLALLSAIKSAVRR